MVNATAMPIIGARGINKSVLEILSILIAPKPALAIAAPAKPPKRACDELVGIPFHQVNRFHIMAPLIPPASTVRVTISVLPIPPTVAATLCAGINLNATKLKNAAQTTAWKGVSTRVETTVAIELAES